MFLVILPGSGQRGRAGLSLITGLRSFKRGNVAFTIGLSGFLLKIRRAGFHAVIVEEVKSFSKGVELQPLAFYSLKEARHEKLFNDAAMLGGCFRSRPCLGHRALC